MGMLRGLAKAGIARRVFNEARKPQNQTKIRQAVSRFTSKGTAAGGTRRRPR